MKLFLDDADLDKPRAELVESQNKKFFRERANAWVNIAAAPMVREAERWGYEMDPISWLKDENFSMREATKQLREGKFRLTEAVTTSMLYALSSIATIASAASYYKLTPAVYRSLCEIVPSKKAEETYFALQRGDIPGPVGETGAAPESRVGGVLVRIKNYDFARIWRVSRNMEDDDQTGQLGKMGQLIGEGMTYTEELWALTVFFYAYQVANVRPGGGANAAGSGIIPPRCIAGQNPADGGPTTAAGDITLTNAEVLYQAADYVTDMMGNYALIEPDSILVAGSRRINARKIFGSEYNPGGYSTSAASGSQAGIGGVGVMAINPLAGLLKIHHTPFVNKVRAGLDSTNPPWAIGMAGKGWKFQDREPLEVIQEAENAGESFRQRSRGTRAWRRFGAGLGEGEFWLVGN